MIRHNVLSIINNMLKAEEKTHRLFLKSLRLIEERLRLNIKNAILIIDTDFDDYSFVYKDTPETLILCQKFFHQRLTEFTQQRHAGQIIMCDKCLGHGEFVEGDCLRDCPKCKGGGIMAITITNPNTLVQVDI